MKPVAGILRALLPALWPTLRTDGRGTTFSASAELEKALSASTTVKRDQEALARTIDAFLSKTS